MGGAGAAPGAARLHLAEGVPLLRPGSRCSPRCSTGWRAQQLARNLAFATIEGTRAGVGAGVRRARGCAAVAVAAADGR